MAQDGPHPGTIAIDGRATTPHWSRVGSTKRAGILAPLFSLRSRRSAGIGDIVDIERAVDWAVQIGASIVQLLPLNDLGPDSAPYGAISAFAIDPIYVALDRVPIIAEDATLRARVESLQRELESATRVDYARVRPAKLGVLEAAFDQHRAELDGDSELRAFCEAHAEWLDDYVLYRVLREVHDWRSWESWDSVVADSTARHRFAKAHTDRLAFHRFVQWALDTQLRAAHEYARGRGVLLEGDIPILVGRDSADVWRNRHLFRLETMAGAPPDMYSDDGQVWGFPTYDWDAHHADGCAWWRRRLAHAERYFDLYRIDHVVGLFRIWTVDKDAKTAREGYFAPRDEAAWEKHGRRILTMMLDATHMLPLAEDLGTVPDLCRETLRDLGICGMKVARWERHWKGDGTFVHPREFLPLSVATLATHDSETFAGWWREVADDWERQRLFELLGRTGTAPQRPDADLLCAFLHQIAGAGSVYVVLLLQDLLQPFGYLPESEAEVRVNLPGTVGPHNWTFRLPVPLERLIEDSRMNDTLRDLLRRP